MLWFEVLGKNASRPFALGFIAVAPVSAGSCNSCRLKVPVIVNGCSHPVFTDGFIVHFAVIVEDKADA